MCAGARRERRSGSQAGLMGQSEGTVVFLGMVPLTRAYSSHGVWNLDFLAATSGPPCPRSGICTGICTFVGGTLTAHVFFFSRIREKCLASQLASGAKMHLAVARAHETCQCLRQNSCLRLRGDRFLPKRDSKSNRFSHTRYSSNQHRVHISYGKG